LLRPTELKLSMASWQPGGHWEYITTQPSC